MLKRFSPVIILVAACWVVLLANNLFWNGQLNQHGIIPRHLGGLPGIIWAPFLHASFKHLAANTLPLLLLGGIICARSKAEFWSVAATGALLGGGLTWVFARSASHIGASGLIFCFFGYLASLAVFHRTFGTLALSVVCILAYGGIVRGILPGSGTISWESHLAGLVAGVGLAWISSKVNPPQAKLELQNSIAEDRTLER